MEIINKSLVLLDQNFNSKKEILMKISNIAVENKIAELQIFDELEEREKEFSTAMGFDIAIPHAKSNKIIRPKIIIIRNSKYINWDNEKIKLAIAILTPEKSDNIHLSILSDLSRKLVHEGFRKKLMETEDESNIVKLIIEGGEKK